MTRIWYWMERLLGAVAMLALFSLVVLPALQVTLRGVFGHPLLGLEESTRWGLIILVFLSTPLLISTNEHIRLAEFVDFLPRRLRMWLERVILLVSGVTLMTIAWSGVLSVLRNIGTRTPMLDIPFWLFATPMLLGFTIAGVGYMWLGLRRAEPPICGATPII
jgi:TRAP-type C4-dicarboxylate transport system permease small subunit